MEGLIFYQTAVEHWSFIFTGNQFVYLLLQYLKSIQTLKMSELAASEYFVYLVTPLSFCKQTVDEPFLIKSDMDIIN